MPSSTLSRALVTFGLIVSVMLPLAAQQPADTTQQTDYVLGPQDVFNITVWGPGGVSERFTVEADGTFTFPMLGRVKAGGLTVRQLQDELTDRLRDGYFNDPRVTVVVERVPEPAHLHRGRNQDPGHVQPHAPDDAPRGAGARWLDHEQRRRRGCDPAAEHWRREPTLR